MATERPVQWQAPPPARGRVQRRVEELRKQPGQWALIYEGAETEGGRVQLWKNGCEVRTRQRDDGLYDIYARWPEAAS